MIKKDYSDNSDNEGFLTLSAISSATNFNKWMSDIVKKRAKGKILEIGSGIGNISQFFVANKTNIHLSEINLEYVSYLKKKYAQELGQENIFELNLVSSEFDIKYAHLFNNFDTIFALNVIEHIEDHKTALVNCKKLLKVGGIIIILVPAYQLLYNTFDTNLAHFRRYTRKKIETIFLESEISVKESFYFNFFGIFGWFLFGTIFRQKTIPENSMGIFDKLVFMTKNLDLIFSRIMGLSVVCIGNKENV